MVIDPCAKLTIRVTPKIRDRPTAMRNSVEAPASPLRSWTLSEAIMVSGHPDAPAARAGDGHAGGGDPHWAGRSLATSASDGITVAPSM